MAKELTPEEISEIPNLDDYELLQKINNPKYEKFATYYVRCNSQGEAARLAGYAEISSRNQGYEIMKNPYVRELVRRKQADIAKEIGVTEISLAEKLKHIAMASIDDFNEDWNTRKDWNDIEVGKFHAIQEIHSSTKTYTNEEGDTETTVETKIKLKDSMKANEQLRELLGYKKNKEEDKEKEPLDTSNIPPEELAILAKWANLLK